MSRINKRDFLLGSATAVASSGALALDAGRQLAGVRPRLDEHSGVVAWQAYCGQEFQLGGRRVQLEQVQMRRARSEQFSLSFKSMDGAGATSGLQQLSHASGAELPLFVVATPSGLRADFARA